MKEQFFNQQSDKNRAALEAQLLGQGFTQAQNLAGQAFNQQRALAAGQLGLAQQGTFISRTTDCRFNNIGGQQQAREQQLLSADQQLAQRQAFQPLEAAQQLGSRY